MDPDLSPDRFPFYQDVLTRLAREQIPFLVGGAYALERYTGVNRDTKDLDLFIAPRDLDRVLATSERGGDSTERTFPHWLAKIRRADHLIDLIYSSGNGISTVDEEWFAHAPEGELLGQRVRFIPREEMIWSKAFIMERDRYDGADIAHVLRGDTPLDWPRLLRRFGPHWRVLLSHVVLFGFIYPGQRDRIPGWVIDELTARLGEETQAPANGTTLCRGTLLSFCQYALDLSQGHEDARLAAHGGTMTPEHVHRWTTAEH